MSRSGVVFIAAASGFLVLAMLVRHLRQPESEQLAAVRRVPFSAAASDRGGWNARSDSDTVAGPSGEGRSARGSSVRGAESGDRGEASSGGSDDADRMGGRGRGADALRSGGASGTVYPGSGSMYSGSGSIRVGSSPAGVAEPSAAGDGSSPRPRGAARLNDVPAQGVTTTLQQNPQGDTKTAEDQPVVNLFDTSGQPDKTENQPVAQEGVTIDERGAHFDTNSQFEIPNAGNMNGEAGTLSFCIQPEWQGGDASNASFVQLRNQALYENRLQLFKNGRYLRLIVTPNTGVESGASKIIDDWQPNQMHSVVAVYGKDPVSGDNIAALYVDGHLAGPPGTYDGNFEVSPSTPLLVGSDYRGDAPGAGGTMSNFQGFNQVLSQDRIASLAGNCVQ